MTRVPAAKLVAPTIALLVAISAAEGARRTPPAASASEAATATSAPSASLLVARAEAAARDRGDGARATKGPCAPEPPLAPPRWFAPPKSALVEILGEAPLVFGSASIGRPTRGALFGGVELGESEGIARAGGYGWGTDLAVRSIERAVREVRRCFPATPRLYVGDLSREHGGWLRPHASHQSGLDADLGYYYRRDGGWYVRATKDNLDAPRTWALVRALLDGGDVDAIFMDASVQRLLRAHVATLPEEERPRADPFASPTRPDAVIRHAWGHATHFHVRFTDATAVDAGRSFAPTR